MNSIRGIVNILEFSQKFVKMIVESCSSVWNILNSSVIELVNDQLGDISAGGILGDIFEWVTTNLFNNAFEKLLGDVTLIELMFGSAIVFIVFYRIFKFLIEPLGIFV